MENDKEGDLDAFSGRYNPGSERVPAYSDVHKS